MKSFSSYNTSNKSMREDAFEMMRIASINSGDTDNINELKRIAKRLKRPRLLDDDFMEMFQTLYIMVSNYQLGTANRETIDAIVKKYNI